MRVPSFKRTDELFFLWIEYVDQKASCPGAGYEQKDVLIEMADGTAVRAFCYCATAIDPGLKPFDWYKEHVLMGARENNLPEVNILGIKSIEAVWYSDTIRRECELSIYRKIPDQRSVSSSIRKPR